LSAWNHSKVPQEDLIGLGNEALLKSARQWVPSNGAKFATYAKRFILRGVERGLDNTENLVRIPIKVREEIRKMTYTERALKQTLMRPPTVAELADVLGKSVKRVNQLKFYLIQEPTSLDALNLDKLEEDGDE
jgi:DNA-directed RNA polymerase sigma subunit (sigma70/sigma32)